MAFPQKDIVEPIIDKHRKTIVAAVFDAWEKWFRSPHNGVWRCKRSRANFVWEEIIDRLHLAFEQSSGVRITRQNETFTFLLDDLVLIRIKKGNAKGLSANVSTQLAFAFHDHDQDLPGLPEVQRVEIVYQLNHLESEIVDVLVVARNKQVMLWPPYSLLKSDEIVEYLPTQTTNDEADMITARDLVHPRALPEKQKNKRN